MESLWEDNVVYYRDDSGLFRATHLLYKNDVVGVGFTKELAIRDLRQKFYERAGSDTTYEIKLTETLSYVEELVKKKHHDYGDKNLLKHGMFGIIVRMSDKLARLENLTKLHSSGKVEDETIYNTIIDLIGYSVQSLVLYDKLMEGETSEKEN